MAEFTLGARASCPDGFCGVVRGTIVDPAARTVTHLVIEPENGAVARLVPLDRVEGTADDVRLRCTLDEFGRLDPAEKVLGTPGPVPGTTPAAGWARGAGARWWSTTPSRWGRPRWSAIKACTRSTARSG
ncbi:MAG TPA: hypothetical protein VK584_04415, partial [Streptosporangiaceae bacterium]|nr:hypothetical protein [Streptosporangiaceae bacterium]